MLPIDQYQIIKSLSVCTTICAKLLHSVSVGMMWIRRDVQQKWKNTFYEGLKNVPNTSTRAVARSAVVSQTTVWRVLHEHKLHPFHLQRIQALKAEDYPLHVQNSVDGFCSRVQFSQIFHHMCSSLMKPFSHEGMLNVHNAYLRANTNPHAAVSVWDINCCWQGHMPGSYDSPSMFWAGIIDNFLIRP